MKHAYQGVAFFLLNTVQARKHTAVKDGKRMFGRRITHLIDQRFEITEADVAVYDTEQLFSVAMTRNNLQLFLCTWGTVLPGLRAKPEPVILEVSLAD